jgi:hypothetical protein
MSDLGGWMPFDVHDGGNKTPRARIQVNTGGNSASMTLEPITLDLGEDGNWTATATDEGLNRTFTGRADSATGAIIVLLADRLGLDAEVRMRPALDEVMRAVNGES